LNSWLFCVLVGIIPKCVIPKRSCQWLGYVAAMHLGKRRILGPLDKSGYNDWLGIKKCSVEKISERKKNKSKSIERSKVRCLLARVC
jgi:hypothetical protein